MPSLVDSDKMRVQHVRKHGCDILDSGAGTIPESYANLRVRLSHLGCLTVSNSPNPPQV